MNFKKVFGIILTFASLIFISCTDKQTKKEIIKHKQASEFNVYVLTEIQNQQKLLEEYVDSLTLEQKISQLFIENLEGNTQFRSYETVGVMNGTDDKTPLVAGGYIFFGKNICDTVEDMQAFIQTIKDYCVENNVLVPYLAVDQEGGWVSRLKKLNTKLPSNEDVAKNNSIEQAYSIYEEQALQMKNLGFHMNIAPVVEVCTPDNAEFLDGRSFGDENKVSTYGLSCVNAYENNEIATVVKHFPGNTNTDPHTGLPFISLEYDDLMESIKPFKYILEHNPTAVLMSHARTKALDSEVPACLSKVWVTDILRNKYGYNGIIFSDDIFMGALADNGYPPEKAVVMAIEAGIDCIMISEKRFGKSAAILYKKAKTDEAFANRIDESVKRIIKYKVEQGIISIYETETK